MEVSEPRGRLGEGRPQARRRHDAAAGVAAPGSGGDRRLCHAGIKAVLDRAAAAKPNPGPSLLHRLNRAEYANAIRDLLALDIDVAALLPPDDSSYGFDNIADVLGISPALLERYLTAADEISAVAVGRLRGRCRGQRHLHRAGRHDAGRSRRGPAARHARRPARSPHVPARRRVPASRSSCGATTRARSAACRSRTMSRSPSTASASS